jgi:hypothetical protein
MMEHAVVREMLMHDAATTALAQNTNSLDKKMLYESIESIMFAGLCDVAMHEVGRTLGLRHNFVASASPDHSWEQLGNRTNVPLHGVATSVMDYNSINIRSAKQQRKDVAAGRSAGSAKENQDVYFMSHVGSYDIAAIKYGYSNPKPTKGDANRDANGDDGASEYNAEARMSTISGDVSPITASSDSSSESSKPAALLYTANGQVAPVAASAFAMSGDGDRVSWNLALRHIAASAPAFETDEDVSDANPYAQRHDLGEEPMDYHLDRLQLVREMRAMMTQMTNVTVASTASEPEATQELVKDGESWERWWRMERVLLGTVAASGVRVAQYVGGSAMSKAHRGDSGTDTPPVTPVAWLKQRAAVQMVMEQILPISIGNDNDASRSNSNSNSTANRLYPPASQDRYMIQRAKPAWCNGHGALFDYCHGQEPAHMAEKLNSVKTRANTN